MGFVENWFKNRTIWGWWFKIRWAIYCIKYRC